MSFGAMTARWSELRPVQNVLARLTAITLGLLALAWLPRPHTVCPLLMLTGVPCPFCGGTHAGIDLGQGHPAAALRASPLAVCGAAVVIILPVLRTTSLAGRWRELPARTRSTVLIVSIVATLAASEVWQLGRFGLL